MFSQPDLMSKSILNTGSRAFARDAAQLKDADFEFVNRVDEVEKEYIKNEYQGLNDNHFKYRPKDHKEKPYKVMLGQGEFSVIRLAKAIIDGNLRYFALKKVKSSEALKTSRINVKITHDDVMNIARNEQIFMQVIEKINNDMGQSVALPYKFIEQKNKNSEAQIYQIFPLADIGNLTTFRDYLFSNQYFLRPEYLEVFHVMALKLLKTVGLLHDHNIYNRDIKPDNILLSTQGDLWVSDFGSAMMIENEVDGYEQHKLVSTYSDSKYIHPKLADCMRNKIKLKPSVWGTAHDKWALGITLLKILSPDTNLIAEKLLNVDDVEECSTNIKVLQTITVFKKLPIYLQAIILDLLDLDINHKKSISSLLKQHIPIEVHRAISNETAIHKTLKVFFHDVLQKVKESEEIEAIDELVSDEESDKKNAQKRTFYDANGAAFFQPTSNKDQQLEMVKTMISLRISQYPAVEFAADLSSDLNAGDYQKTISERLSNNNEINCIFYLNRVVEIDEYLLMAYLKDANQKDANQVITKHGVVCFQLEDAGSVLLDAFESFENEFLQDIKIRKKM